MPGEAGGIRRLSTLPCGSESGTVKESLAFQNHGSTDVTKWMDTSEYSLSSSFNISG